MSSEQLETVPVTSSEEGPSSDQGQQKIPPASSAEQYETPISSSSGDGIKNDVVFAQPFLPPPKAVSSGEVSSSEATSSSPSTTSKSTSSPQPPKPEKLSREKEEKYKQILSTLNYHPPECGSSTADTRYNLEVLKNGTIVESVRFSAFQGYFIVGRVPGCDVVAENPTVSRMHAILQFVKGTPSSSGKTTEEVSDNPQQTGLYLYDLNSTHGTFLNKNQLFPRKWYRVHVGHVLKFGSSQRMYIVNGPDEDEEEESEKSVTELQNERLQKELQRKRLEEEGQLKREKASGITKLPKENIEEEGIDWGMAEDADEESDMRINPFALDYETSELNLDNPKKTLRSWFEREGHDLEYEMREKSAGQYICRIGLPMEGAASGDGLVYAESEVKTKKKEAAAEAAMKACQILDSHGLLRTSNQESRKRKEKKWEDEDYYSSDEDTFLDRTGSVEKKREKRMRLAGKAGAAGQDVMTYENLCAKHTELEKEIGELKEKIESGEKLKERADDGDVDIDDYMNLLKSGVFDVKKLKGRLKTAQEEIARTKKLMEIAKPAELPSYLQGKPQDTSVAEVIKTEATLKVEENNPTPKPTPVSGSPRKPIIGPRKPPQISAPPPPPQPKPYGLITPSNFAILKAPLRPPDAPPKALLEDDEAPFEEEDESSDEEPGADNADDDEDVEDDTPADSATSSAVPEFERPVKKKRQRYRNQQKGKSNAAGKKGQQNFQDDEKFSEWVPPTGQTGDGRTSLNEKLGY